MKESQDTINSAIICTHTHLTITRAVYWQRETEDTWAGVAVVGKSVATTTGAVVAVVRVNAHLSAIAIAVPAFVDSRVGICNRQVT